MLLQSANGMAPPPAQAPRGRKTALSAGAGALAVLLAASLACLAGQEAAGERVGEPAGGREEAAAGETTPPRNSLRILAGQTVPALQVRVLWAGSLDTVSLDLGKDLGKRAIVFVYFLIHHAISEELVRETDAFVAGMPQGSVAFYPVVRLGVRHRISDLSDRLEELGVRVPVIVDEDSLIQERLGAGVVPHLALVDKKGVLRFNRASSLKQPVLGDVDVAEAIRMAARGEEPPAVMGLLRYYPANDLVGEPYRDFELADVLNGRPVRLGAQVEPGKIAAVLYWSPRCPYSKSAMRGIVVAHRSYGPRFLNLISVARDGTQEEIREYAAAQGIEFPILEDRNKIFANLYKVVSTPTLVVIGPGGAVESVHTSGRANFLTIIRAKVHSLLVNPEPQ